MQHLLIEANESNPLEGNVYAQIQLAKKYRKLSHNARDAQGNHSELRTKAMNNHIYWLSQAARFSTPHQDQCMNSKLSQSMLFQYFQRTKGSPKDFLNKDILTEAKSGIADIAKYNTEIKRKLKKLKIKYNRKEILNYLNSPTRTQKNNRFDEKDQGKKDKKGKRNHDSRVTALQTDEARILRRRNKDPHGYDYPIAC